MIKVGISGKIASGKSLVEDIIKSFGYSIYDLDKIVHEFFETNEAVKQALTEEFQTSERKEVASIVFKSSEKKQKLEKIIYPELERVIFDIFKEKKDEAFVFISGALLFKSGFSRFFDKIIFVDSSDDIRLKRLMKRNNLSYDEALLRLNLQDDKNDSDFIIENNKDTAFLKAQVEEVLKKLKSIQ